MSLGEELVCFSFCRISTVRHRLVWSLVRFSPCMESCEFEDEACELQEPVVFSSHQHVSKAHVTFYVALYTLSGFATETCRNVLGKQGKPCDPPTEPSEAHQLSDIHMSTPQALHLNHVYYSLNSLKGVI